MPATFGTPCRAESFKEFEDVVENAVWETIGYPNYSFLLEDSRVRDVLPSSYGDKIRK